MGLKLDQWVADYDAHEQLEGVLDNVADVEVSGGSTGTTIAVELKLKNAEGADLEVSPRIADALANAMDTMQTPLLNAIRTRSAALLEELRLEARAEAQEVLDQTEDGTP